MTIKYNLFKCSNDIESKTSYNKHFFPWKLKELTSIEKVNLKRGQQKYQKMQKCSKR